MEETKQEISDGLLSFLIQNNGKKRYVCFEFPYDPTVDYVAYSISILEPTKLDNIYNFYPPQIIGDIYRRMIPKGSYAVYHWTQINMSDKRVIFNIYNKVGDAKLYIDKCTSFPNCIYTQDQIEGMKELKRINRMAIGEKKIDNSIDALSSDKYVMVV